MPKTLYEVFLGEPPPEARSWVCRHVTPEEVDAILQILMLSTVGACDPCRTQIVEAIRQYLGGATDSHSA